MADTNMDKEAKKEAQKAEKEALKAKKERIKASKPKKDGNIFTRAGKAIARYFKDFRGTTKKIIWPPRKTVFKNAGIVLASIFVAGIAVYGVDQALTAVFGWGTDLSIQAGEMFTEAETTTAAGATTTAAAGATTAASTDNTTVASDSTTAQGTTAEETAAQTTAAAESESATQG